MKKIFWSDDEKRSLCEVGVDIRKSMLGGRISYLSILNRSQREALPVERRRKIVAFTSHLKWFEVGVETLYNQYQREAQLTATKPVNPPISEVKIEELIDEVLKRVFDNRTNRLADAVAHKVIDMMHGMVQGMIASQLAKPNGNHEVVRKRRILIVGLQPDQIKTIEHTYEDFFDLRFARDSHDGRLRELASNSSAVVLMSKFISHHHQNAAKDAFPGKVTYCHGGMSDLDKTLSQIHDQK